MVTALLILAGVYLAGVAVDMVLWAAWAGPYFFPLFGSFLYASLYWPEAVLEKIFGD